MSQKKRLLPNIPVHTTIYHTLTPLRCNSNSWGSKISCHCVGHDWAVCHELEMLSTSQQQNQQTCFFAFSERCVQLGRASMRHRAPSPSTPITAKSIYTQGEHHDAGWINFEQYLYGSFEGLFRVVLPYSRQALLLNIKFYNRGHMNRLGVGFLR